MRTGIYAIYDKVAHGIVGGLHLHKHQAAAERFYNDVMGTRDTVVGQHPEDYDLIRVGTLMESDGFLPELEVVLKSGNANDIECQTAVVLSGVQWVAIHAAQAAKLADSTAQNEVGRANGFPKKVRETK